MGRRVRSDGVLSRESILRTAERLATVEGLEGLSLARLAEAAGMSKSGVFGLFGSKLELQLATIEKAREVFLAEVVYATRSVPPGRERLLALCEGYLDYVRGRVWPSGCFFASVASEVAPRPGPLRDRIAEYQRNWVGLLSRQARYATENGELPAGTDPDRLGLELSTMLTGTDIGYLLHEDAKILERVREALRARLAPRGRARAG